MKFFLIFIIFLVSVHFAQAQKSLPYYEPFNYPTGVLGTQGGWGASGALATVDNTVNLNYAGLDNSGASTNSLLFGGTTGTNTQPLSIANQTGTVYASFLMRVASLQFNTANSRYSVGFGNTAAGGNFAGTLWVLTNADGVTYELGFHGGSSGTVPPLAANTTAQNFSPGVTTMVVIEYTPGTNVMNVWVNPSSPTFESGSAPTPTFSNVAGGAITNVASFILRCGTGGSGTNGTNPMYLDDLRLGNTWASVTPKAIVTPVKLSSFSSKRKLNTTELSWTAATEIDFDKYVVLYGKNGVDFNEVGTVKGKGNNSKYTFSYAHDGDAYFKLKSVDLNGDFEYSEVIHAKGNTVFIKAGPNPFTDEINIYGMPNGINSVELYNLIGAKIKTQVVNSNDTILSLSTLPSGTYLLKIVNDNKTIFSEKFVK
ncbi:T9SS type A sorting domain-containing protein [Pedobacter glucosidilyticus]|uniref:T9SS type A sorting domain-containing protein n=1 Tax=Pedobacter glucosidilyticus TaxID=1122941 RepID=UPI0004117457|nr:T9SS type A sorting domain-containing protein [Pedobacter glucosidilyticus]